MRKDGSEGDSHKALLRLRIQYSNTLSDHRPLILKGLRLSSCAKITYVEVYLPIEL